jgi:hypothetical protein
MKASKPDIILSFALLFPVRQLKTSRTKVLSFPKEQFTSSTPGLVIWVCGNFPKIMLILTHRPDEDVWDDPNEFRPERWLEKPDAPMFTYGLGYRMCAGSLLANRELYLTFIRMINAFEIQV